MAPVLYEERLVIWKVQDGDVQEIKGVIDGEVFRKISGPASSPSQEPAKLKTQTPKKRGAHGLFKTEDIITKHHGAMIYKPVVKYLVDTLEPTFTLKDIVILIGIFYQEILKRPIRQPSIRTYSGNYRDHLVSTGEILDVGDGTYQLKFGGESVKLDLPPKKPPVKLSYLEKWLIKTMPKKPFDIEDFFNDYPKQRHHKKRVEAVLSELCAKHILTQLGPNRFKLNSVKPEEGR